MKTLHTALGALLLTPLFALAEPAEPGMPPMGPGHMAGMRHGHGGEGGPGMMLPLHALKLDEAQRDKIFAIHHAQAPAMRNAMKALRQSHDDLRKLAIGGKFDEARAKALADAGARAGAELALLHARSTAQIVALLTDAQKKQLEELQARAGDGPRGRGHGPFGGPFGGHFGGHGGGHEGPRGGQR